MAKVADLPPGRALDAACGHGVDMLWLAAHGWHVTAVDFSAAALDDTLNSLPSALLTPSPRKTFANTVKGYEVDARQYQPSGLHQNAAAFPK